MAANPKILPVFGFDMAAKSVNVASQGRTNLYCEVKPEKDKTSMVLYRTAGTSSFNSNGGASPYRGVSKQIGNLFYGVKAGTLYEVNNAGVETSRGTINTTSGNVGICDNGKQVLIVDGTNGYVYTIATLTLTQIVSVNFPNGATSCDFQGGFFLVDDPANNGRFWKSASYDGLTWSATDFATAESNPDALVRPFVNHGVVHLFGAITTEFWSNNGGLDFTYGLIQGSPVSIGLAARWSVDVLDGEATFLGKNSEGQVQVFRLSGFQPAPISTPEFDKEINSYTTVSDAISFSYLMDGHRFYQINFPTAGKSWLYDLTTSQMSGVHTWTRVLSNNGRHIANFHVDFVNQIIVTDYATGNLYKFVPTVYTDNGMQITGKLTSKHVYDDNNMVSIGRLWIDMEVGVGLATGQGSNPQVMLRYSHDGGKTWSAELWRPLGPIGNYQVRVAWSRLGRARDWVFELSFSDPVKIVIMNAGARTARGRG